MGTQSCFAKNNRGRQKRLQARGDGSDGKIQRPSKPGGHYDSPATGQDHGAGPADEQPDDEWEPGRNFDTLMAMKYVYFLALLPLCAAAQTTTQDVIKKDVQDVKAIKSLFAKKKKDTATAATAAVSTTATPGSAKQGDYPDASGLGKNVFYAG